MIVSVEGNGAYVCAGDTALKAMQNATMAALLIMRLIPIQLQAKNALGDVPLGREVLLPQTWPFYRTLIPLCNPNRFPHGFRVAALMDSLLGVLAAGAGEEEPLGLSIQRRDKSDRCGMSTRFTGACSAVAFVCACGTALSTIVLAVPCRER